MHTGNELLHKQLLQPEQLQKLSGVVLKYIEENTRWETFLESSVIASNTDVKVVSLHKWCLNVLTTSQTKAFFGQKFLDIQPDFQQIFDEWDQNSWRVTYQLPKFLAKAATQPRDLLIQSMTQLLESSLDDDDAVPFMRELEAETRNAGLSTQDCAGIFMIILWGCVRSPRCWSMC